MDETSLSLSLCLCVSDTQPDFQVSNTSLKSSHEFSSLLYPDLILCRTRHSLTSMCMCVFIDSLTPVASHTHWTVKHLRAETLLSLYLQPKGSG